MKPSTYIETSVISYLTARPSRDVVVAGRQVLTADWWDSCRINYDLYVSALVVEEIQNGDPAAVERRFNAIIGIPALEISEDARAVARMLLESGPMPKQYAEDALHIAICARNGIDYLVTSKCRPLANASMRRQVDRLLDQRDLAGPVICTPEELMESI